MTDLDAGWQDVLRRARRGKTRRLTVAAVAAAVMLSSGSALAVLLTRPAYATLPPAADQTKASVVLAPSSGRILLQVAPWRGHPGVCYVVLRQLAGCTRTVGRHGTVFFNPPRVLMTFDARVVGATGTRLYRFPRYRIAFALPPKGVCTIKLLNSKHKTITSLHVGCR
ncbi:MAG TPA: hypothetical protein VHB97_03425 [Polyangia bacterium]|jgi:hypothetical protein|nr:hypothetical protein [Polyangia bacterium]